VAIRPKRRECLPAFRQVTTDRLLPRLQTRPDWTDARALSLCAVAPKDSLDLAPHKRINRGSCATLRCHISIPPSNARSSGSQSRSQKAAVKHHSTPRRLRCKKKTARNCQAAALTLANRLPTSLRRSCARQIKVSTKAHPARAQSGQKLFFRASGLWRPAR